MSYNSHYKDRQSKVIALTVTWTDILDSSGQKSCSEKAMAAHSSTLGWKIPWMEEPGRLQSMGSLRVGHD